MTVATRDTADAGGHVVQFYAHDSELIPTVGAYLLEGVNAGEIAIAITTEAHRNAFQAHLDAAGVNLDQARREGTLVWLDAAETLAKFMPGGKISPDAFHEVIGGLVREAVATGKPVRAYGEMVALLWDDGDVLAAIDLESLWNDLGQEVPFSLFCAYHSDSVTGSEHAEALEQVCHLHSSVVRAPEHDDLSHGGSPDDDEIRRFAAETDSPRAARHFLVDALRQRGYEGPILDDAQIVLSELASNAVIHAGSPFAVALRAGGSVLRISVHDDSPVIPTLREDDSLPSGRGLRLVAALSRSWGVEMAGDGKRVWAELPA
jgi:anti-sigma regulatory factor (Ser/Thr protein kinase)